MLNKSFPKKLKPFFEAVKNIPCKNDGGCLLFCYCFWLWLKKNNIKTDSFQIVQYDHSSKYNIETNLKWIDGEEEEAVSSYHYTWIYDGIEYDSEQIKPKCKVETNEVLLGLNTKNVCLIDDFCENALNNGNWNSCFNRAKYIPIIEKSLGIDLSLIDF